MKITFLGTCGYIQTHTRTHRLETATLIEYRGKRIMIDCGGDWLKRVWRIKPDAIVLTHAHPDHVDGLKNGSPCPVYAPRQTWKLIENFLIPESLRNTIYFTKPNLIYGLLFQPIRVKHSLHAPAVSYRITVGKKVIFYAGDVAYIPNTKRVLRGVQLYIGDGATITTPLIRKKNGEIFGHTTIKTQLTWCQKAGVKHAIFTHCGSPIVSAHRASTARIKRIARDKNIEAQVAHDGQVITI